MSPLLRMDIPVAVWLAVQAGRHLERSRDRMNRAREIRTSDGSPELVCTNVRWAREWRQRYRKTLAEALMRVQS